MVSLYDIVDFTTRAGPRARAAHRETLGAVTAVSDTVALGARGGDSDRMLDLPVRNLMSDVVVTIRRSASLDEVVETMFEREISSLVVLEDESDEPIGVVTKTDVLEALTWEQEDRNAVQVFGLTCWMEWTMMVSLR